MGDRITPKSPVGARLREARLAKGISQKGLGIKAGIDEFSASARINQYERGKHVPDFSIARRLAKALGVPVTYLYADDDNLAELIVHIATAKKQARARALKVLKGSRVAQDRTGEP